MDRDDQLLQEAYLYVNENALVKKAANLGAKAAGNKFVGKAVNMAAGTKLGQAVGGAALDEILQQLSAEEKQWLAANIDNDEALQNAAEGATTSNVGQEISAETGVEQSVMQKAVTNIISQPNIKQIVKQKLGVPTTQ